MRIDATRVLEGRRAEREGLIGRARELAARLDPVLAPRAVVVFGSVARGDFNLWSDVDVLVVADNVPPGWSERIAAIGPPPPRVAPVVWTPEEFRSRLGHNNPIAREAVDRGVWLVGGPDEMATGDTPL
jgi:predicted nucleotidyltransferase